MIEKDNSNNNLDNYEGISPFSKKVVEYFMEFLETDFHKRRRPKRYIKIKNQDNLLVGLNTIKYKKFYKKIWKFIKDGLDKEEIAVSKGVYETQLPDNLQKLIDKKIDKIVDENYKQAISDISEAVENSCLTEKSDPSKALEKSFEQTSEVLKESIVLPLSNSIYKSIENTSSKNTVYLIEEDLTDVLAEDLKDIVEELVNSFLSDDDFKLSNEIKNAVDKKSIKEECRKFFSGFSISDLYEEVYEMSRNRKILDKHELYLYFGDIKFRNIKYPIFYTPINTRKEGDSLYLNLDSKIYINKKALEFVVQEYKKETGSKGSLETITNRIIYIADHEEKIDDIIKDVFDELSDFFKLDKKVDIFESGNKTAKSLHVDVSDACYLSLFDKTDEALINDYEELLKYISGESELGEAFADLIGKFIHENPKPFGNEIEKEWDEQEVPEKLTFQSPIPLNSEQRKILSAVSKKDCKYITVEGPPGTGKSHTITAVVFDAILNGKSALILSDKQEALDVVESKITKTLEEVRHRDKFQNPVLRLDKGGKNLHKILSKSSVDKIKESLRAVEKDHDEIKKSLNSVSESLKESIEEEIITGSEISMEEIHDFYDLENYFSSNEKVVDYADFENRENWEDDIEKTRYILSDFKKIIENVEQDNGLINLLNFDLKKIESLDDFTDFLGKANQIIEIIDRLQKTFSAELDALHLFESITRDKIKKIDEFVKEVEESRMPIFAFLFRQKEVDRLDKKFRNNFPYSNIDNPITFTDPLKRIVEMFKYADKLREESQVNLNEENYFELLFWLLSDQSNLQSLEELIELEQGLNEIEKLSVHYSHTFKLIGIDLDKFKTLYDNKLIESSDTHFNKNLEYLSLKNKIEKSFKTIPDVRYTRDKKILESLSTIEMSYQMDSRFIDFYENNTATAKEFKEIIRSKRRFPKDDFNKLKKAFPCILAGIRDYAEYIPLEKNIFDLVIIDEASQVSVAQALPALLRAETVLILGDQYQFGNVKAGHAKSETNREYLSELEELFTKNVSKEPGKLERLKNFNIKKSILDFFGFINNFEIMLKKHFRGYKELISFSNKHFYDNSLEVMKVRAKPVSEIMEFTEIDHDSKKELSPNTNSLELDFIIDELKAMKEKERTDSVGIITPFRNQQAFIYKEISGLPESDYFFDKLDLKIMTFDTCQGEERDIVFYSMVANKVEDKLRYVFPNTLDKDVTRNLRMQRLNVGFSRAKEKMHFVMSKPIEEMSSAARKALTHYKGVFEEAEKEKGVEEVDSKSKMEVNVLNWFYQTEFWKDNKDSIMFEPQFPLGKYLKQLDPTYNHPSYKVDFLVVYTDERHIEHKIIIEYDGFQEHFEDLDNVNAFNYKDYYTEDDVYRQKVLEGYGYQFLRINKFNVGERPVEKLNERIQNLIKDAHVKSEPIARVRETAIGLESGEKKVCSWCKEVRDYEDFKDPFLISGYGRKCAFCKGIKRKSKQERKKDKVGLKDESIECPRCGSSMILRKGKYGKFYGCLKFPRCRGTKKYK